jgi:uncharacterized membrane protein
MRTKEFLNRLEHEKIVDAIRAVEAASSAEIRVYLQRGKLELDPLPAAKRKFDQLGMHRTRQHNAVLIFIAPRVHKFAVVGDKAIHEKCGDILWRSVVGKMREKFQKEKFSEAIVEAIGDIGAVLAEHFPRHHGDANELPDDIIEG